MKIKIEHLNYTILVKEPDKNDKFHAYVVKDSDDQCTMYIHRPIKLVDTTTLAHETLHCLQFMSEVKGIDMVAEKEHMGYLLQHIMNKVLGLEYQ